MLGDDERWRLRFGIQDGTNNYNKSCVVIIMIIIMRTRLKNLIMLMGTHTHTDDDETKTHTHAVPGCTDPLVKTAVLSAGH